MLPNYDAKAIAEVMGLAFVRGANPAPPPVGTTTAGKGRPRPVPPASGQDFVIRVDDVLMRIVAAKAKTMVAPFPTAPAPGTRVARPENRPLSSPSSVFIEKAVESGLPRTALRRLAESIAGGDKAKVAALEWGVVPKTTLERRETRLSPQESERTERVARLFVHARRALGTAAEARAFMTTPHPELDGRTPIDAAKTDLGTRRTEQILNALEYGLAL